MRVQPFSTKNHDAREARKFMGKISFVTLGLLLAVLSLPEQLSAQGPHLVEIRQAACGALLRDDFNSGRIDRSVWNIWLADEGLGVSIQDGELSIQGTSARVPEEELLRDEVKLWRFAGLTSRPFPQTDVALAVRLKLPSGISSEPGAHAVSAHLCSAHPDTTAEVLFGKLEGRAMEAVIQRYAKGNPDDVPYPDARGWWLGVVNANQGLNHWLVSGPPLAEQGDEQDTFHDVLVDYDAVEGLSRGFVRVEERWVQLGRALPLFRSLTAVELKTINVTPLHGAYREARFDDCRLYPNPKRNPIRFVLTSANPKLHQGPQNYDLPYLGQKLRVALFSYDGSQKISEGHTDSNGMVVLSVDTPVWVAFPVSAMLRIFRGEEELARSQIEAHGVEGVYPGDVWVFDTRQIP